MTTPADSMELVEIVARASFKNWRDNATAKGLHMDLGMTFEDMSESEREFADRHAAAILTAIESSGRRIVPVEPTPAISRLSVGMSTTHEMARITFSPPLPR